MLAEAVAGVEALDGRRIHMTATPDDELLRRASAGDGTLIRVPARYHGYPMPVPELVADKSLDGGDGALDGGHRGPFRPSQLLLSLIHRSLSGNSPVRVIVFVPTVALAERVGRGL